MKKSKRFCSETEFAFQMQEKNLTDKLRIVLEWSEKIPDHEKYYSCKTNRISFRLIGGKKAFLTIIFKKEYFIYLLNGIGVDMNNQKNWIKAEHSILSDPDFRKNVITNYKNR
jgi:hypothetical protein